MNTTDAIPAAPAAGLTVAGTVHFARRGRTRKLRPGPAPAPPVPGRVPRVARLMALALKLDEAVRVGGVASHAELARVGHVTRARVSQIMSLLHLAPDLQEAILFLPKVQRGRDPIILADLRPITATLDWRKQRNSWRVLLERKAAAAAE